MAVRDSFVDFWTTRTEINVVNSRITTHPAFEPIRNNVGHVLIYRMHVLIYRITIFKSGAGPGGSNSTTRRKPSLPEPLDTF